MPARKPTDLVFSKERYEEFRGEILLHMSHFFLGYLNDIYQAFEGDLAMVIILGEISHHNTTSMFSPHDEANHTLRAIQGEPESYAKMDGCNAYSISCVTHIPRETVRRKVAELKKRRWVEDIPKEGLRITKTCADHFGADYSLRFLNGMLRASRIIESLMADKIPPAGEDAKPKDPLPGPKQSTPSKAKPKTRKPKP